MIDDLNGLLRHLLITRLSQIEDEAQVRFETPDDDWRTYVANLTVNGNAAIALNVFLMELRENRNRRSNERTRDITDGIVTDVVAPRRLDCHYWITAWSPATTTATLEPTWDEHELLYDTTAVLMNTTLVPQAVFAPAPLPAGFPAAVAEVQLPTMVAPPDGHPKVADYWTTFGDSYRPGIELVVTLPVVMDDPSTGFAVTSRQTEYLQRGGGDPDTLVQISGVLSDAGGDAIGGAQVRLMTMSSELLLETTTDTRGIYSFSRLRPGTYRVRAIVPGLGIATRDIDVPTSSGNYDIVYP